MVNNKKILILGYFGFETNQLDGQTVKTRDIKKLFDKYLSEGDVQYFDTQLLQKSKYNYFILFMRFFLCNHLVYLPGKSNLLKFRLILNLFISLKKTKVYYIVVGGWLSDFLSVNPKLVNLLHKFEFIGVESNALVDCLSNKFDFENVDFFPNFRIQDFIPEEPVLSKSLKIVFMARVMREKGVDTLFELANAIESKGLDVTITFYGPIVEKDEVFFKEGLDSSKLVNYGGVLDPLDIYKTLSNYDVLVLPTRYEGEGFPGSILDSYISGIPVIVSNWKFLPEFVKEEKTGFVVNDMNELIEKVTYLSKNERFLLDMKKNALQESKLYSSEFAWNKLSSVFLIKSNT